MKAGPLEELVGDTYALLYATVVPDLIAKSNTEENRVRMRVDQLLVDPEAHKIPSPDGKSPDLTTSGVAPVKVRAKGISRREIQRRAESLVFAKAVVPPPISTLRSSSNLKIMAAVEIPERGGMSRQSNGSGVLLSVREKEDGGKEISSIPGSLHDSADDESELSDVEDMMEEVEPGPRIMFPGLVGSRSTRIKQDDEGDEEGEDAGGGKLGHEDEAEEEEEEEGEREGEEREEEEEEEKGPEEEEEEVNEEGGPGKGEGKGTEIVEKTRSGIEDDDRNSEENEDDSSDDTEK